MRVLRQLFFSFSLIGIQCQSAIANPFVPPSQRVDRKVVETMVREAVREELKASKGQGIGTAGMPLPAGLAGGLAQLPSRSGSPAGVSTAGGLAAAPPVVGPADKLLEDGGRFVGCANGTPVFVDKTNRRVYFTTRDLTASTATKRIARCPEDR